MADLTNILQTGSKDACLEFFSQMTETERQSLFCDPDALAALSKSVLKDKKESGLQHGVATSSLVALCEQGRLTTSQVFAETLAGLKCANQHSMPFFIDLVSQLRTLNLDIDPHVLTLVQLLSTSQPEVVSLAIDILDREDLIAKLPFMQLAGELPCVFKGRDHVAVRGLQFLENICSTQEGANRLQLLVASVLHAFENESTNVQGQALEFLKKVACPLEEEFATELRERLLMIDHTLWMQTLDLLDTASGGSGLDEPPIRRFHIATSDTGKLEDLIAQLPSLDAKWMSLAGVNTALAAAKGEIGAAAALSFSAWEVPRLDQGKRLKYIRETDSLIDLFERGLTNKLDDEEMELVLEAVSNVKPPAETDGERIKALIDSAKTKSGPLSTLFFAWLAKRKPEKDQYFENLMHKRIIQAAEALSKGEMAAVIATPTHSPFWIDPNVLVERLLMLESQSKEASLIEQSQALLRLAPDNRKEALVKASGLKGQFAEALRYALGADDTKFGDCMPIWVSAIRARMPLTEPLSMRVKVTVREFVSIDRCLNPRVFTSESALTLRNYIETHTGDHEMMALIGDMDIGNIKSPLCTEVYWARQLRQASESRESGNDFWQDDGWSMLFDADMPIGSMALHALVYGLSSACPDARRTCIAALKAAILDGRIDGLMIGSLIADHFDDLPIKRCLDAVLEAAAPSPLHQQVVHSAFETILGSMPAGDARASELLIGHLYELSIATQSSITSSAARNYLSSIDGQGRYAQMAKRLLELVCQTPNTIGQEAGLIALRERVKRAQRWQSN